MNRVSLFPPLLALMLGTALSACTGISLGGEGEVERPSEPIPEKEKDEEKQETEPGDGGLNCTGPTQLSVTPLSQATEGLTCPVAGLSAIYLDGSLSSTMTQARGFIEVSFYDASGQRVGEAPTLLGRPTPIGWMDTLVDEPVDLSVAVPAEAQTAHIQLITKSTVAGATGQWSLRGLTVHPGVVLSRTEGAKWAKENAPARWSFATLPISAVGQLRVEARNVYGELALLKEVQKNASTPVSVELAPLPVGYYEVSVSFLSTAGLAARWMSSFVVLPATDVPLDLRFGMDAVATWAITAKPGGFESLNEALEMMREAGIGSVRDRFSWEVIQNCNTWTTPGPWGSGGYYAGTARAIHEQGMQAVPVMEGAPRCTRPGTGDEGPETPQIPRDWDNVYESARIYAENMGPYAKAVEYFNEVNASGFFPGYPWQYAAGLKVFNAGIRAGARAVGAEIAVLVSSAAGNPNAEPQQARPAPYFNEVWRNGAASYVDVLNQHYYGTGETLPTGPVRPYYNLHAFQLANVEPMLSAFSLEDYPAWLTETGRNIYRDALGSYASSKIEQAAHLVKTYAAGFGAGYERVFYFSFRQALENERMLWGITSYDFEPHPAYLSLALLTRHLQGATPVRVQVAPNHQQTVFFTKPDGQRVAVSWAGAEAILALGTGVEIRDIFGRRVSPNAVDNASVYLLSGLPMVPSGADTHPVPLRSRPASTEAVPLMLLPGAVKVDGVEQTGVKAWSRHTYVPAPWGSSIEVSLQTRGANNQPVSDAVVACLPGGPGVTLTSEARPTAVNGEYICRYHAQVADYSYITMTAHSPQAEDRVHIPLEFSATNVVFDEHLASGACPSWSSIAHTPAVSSYTLSALPRGSACPAQSIEASIQGANSVVGPSFWTPQGQLSGVEAIRVRLSDAEGKQRPTGVFNILLVGNGTWVANTLREGDTYVGDLRSAHRIGGIPEGQSPEFDAAATQRVDLVWSYSPVGEWGVVVEAVEFGRTR
ncbi:MAG: hypothetical protein FWG75_03210 [Cystobacterineae bacterium]|nr:hypothetical protein [Cystobacterineae bacterium]